MKASDQSQRPHRRDVITGAAVAKTLQTTAAAAVEAFCAEAAPAAPLRELPVVTYGRRAMACPFEIRLPMERAEEGAEGALAALDRVDELEQLLSVYRDDSGVAALNRQARAGTAVAPNGIAELLELGAQLFAETGGAYDLTSGPLSQTWGFARRAGRVPTAEELSAARERVGWQRVRWNLAERTMAFEHPELEVNFNSIGKGYALDQAGEVLAAHGAASFLFHGGRSSLLARGSNPALARGGWQVGLTHPLRPQQRLGVFTLHDQGFSTSGSGTQYFYHQGRRYGHLLDPRTGLPVEGPYSVSVLAPTATLADALSTAFFVQGREAAADYCQRHPEVAALFVLPAGGDVELSAVNLPPERWAPSCATAL